MRQPSSASFFIAATSAAGSVTSAFAPSQRAETSAAAPGTTGNAPEREKQATWRPCCASASAMAAPMPRLAPVTTMHSRSLITELRLAFLDEGLHAFLGVPGAVRQRGEIGFHAQPFVQRQVQRALHRLPGELQRPQAVAAEFARIGLGRGEAGRL